VRIPVLDNGGQWTHREYRVLRDLDVDSRIVPNTTPYERLNADGVVLSGGALSLEDSETPLGSIGDWIDRAEIPVLGICVGHQFLARHFGGTVARSGSPEFGRVAVSLDAPDHPLFAGLPPSVTVWSNHNDSVVRLPPDWRRLAHSESCPVQAMSQPSRPVFGVQFHPEVEHTERGRDIFRNFVELCRR
jgi:GMP synthase (glutamine-hydrolysing)